MGIDIRKLKAIPLSDLKNHAKKWDFEFNADETFPNEIGMFKYFEKYQTLEEREYYDYVQGFERMGLDYHDEHITGIIETPYDFRFELDIGKYGFDELKILKCHMPVKTIKIPILYFQKMRTTFDEFYPLQELITLEEGKEIVYIYSDIELIKKARALMPSFSLNNDEMIYLSY